MTYHLDSASKLTHYSAAAAMPFRSNTDEREKGAVVNSAVIVVGSKEAKSAIAEEDNWFASSCQFPRISQLAIKCDNPQGTAILSRFEVHVHYRISPRQS